MDRLHKGLIGVIAILFIAVVLVGYEYFTFRGSAQDLFNEKAQGIYWRGFDDCVAARIVSEPEGYSAVAFPAGVA